MHSSIMDMPYPFIQFYILDMLYSSGSVLAVVRQDWGRQLLGVHVSVAPKTRLCALCVSTCSLDDSEVGCSDAGSDVPPLIPSND